MAIDCENSKSAGLWDRLLAVVVVLSVWLWIFWPILFAGKTVGFRDAVYMHYPVLKWTTDEMMAGRLPLWSPNDGPGMPVVGEGSTGIFYPLKGILFLPGCSFVYRYNLFLALHVFLANFTGYWCARRFGCSRIAATIAGLSFGFSGPVLFQVTNQIFLVSAAWLPVAVGCVRDLFCVSHPKRVIVRKIVACSVAMSMMVLGGDPQMAAMIVLVISGTICATFVLKRFPGWRTGTNGSALGLPRTHSLMVSLVSICVVSFLLSAVQILPSADFARYSERANWDQPRNIFELTSATLLSRNTEVPVSPLSLVNDPIPGTHHDHIYQFSQPPWSLVELLFPGISGSPWPSNTRWLDGLPGADRMWNVSLYQGGLVLCLAVAVVFLRKSRLDWWLIGMGLFFCLASFGWYGFGWFMREIFFVMGIPEALPWLGRPTGGVYWFLVTFVPVISGFRYPAKLFVIATLCISLLAARNLDRLELPLARKVLARCLFATVVLAVVALPIGWPGWIEGVPQNPGSSDAVFGPLNFPAAHKQVLRSLTFAIFGGLTSLAAVLTLRRRYPGYLPVTLLVLLMLDLSICQNRIVPAINSRVFDAETESKLTAQNWASDFPGYRVLSLGTDRLPEVPGDSDSIHRLEQIAKWQIQIDAPRFNLLSRVVRLDFFGSLQPDEIQLPWLPVVDVFNSNPVERDKVRLWKMNQREWAESKSVAIKSRFALTPRIFLIGLNSDSDTVNFAGNFDLQSVSGQRRLVFPAFANPVGTAFNSGNSYLQVVGESPDRIEADFVFNQTVLLVFPEGWCGGWVIEMDAGDKQPLSFVKSRESGVVWAKIGPGSGKIQISYRSHSFSSGLSISLFSWMAVFGMKVCLRTQTKSR